MRPTNMRRQRTMRLTAGALAIAAPASTVALAADQADAQGVLQMKPAATRLDYGRRLTVTGLAPRVDGGLRLALEISTAGGPWRQIAHTKVHSDGAFRLRAPLRSSGWVRVAPIASAVQTAGKAGTATIAARNVAHAAGAATTGFPAVAASAPEPIAVAAKLSMPTSTVDALSGRRLEVAGRLLPRRVGRVVALQRLTRRGWHTVAVARTHAGGRFVFHHVMRASGKQPVRVSFAGDAGNAGVSTAGRKVVLLHQTVASWYDDAGTTACGFHAGYGVANRDLRCGTKVTFAYGGRTVTAVVDDRGPFVGGRDYDLSQNTASALGFAGVQTVWSSR